MSKQEELEQRIREQRTVEANRKGLVGHGGKIGVVLKIFGQPIVAQSEGGLYVDTNKIDDWGGYDDLEPRNASEMMRKFPTMEMEGNERPSSGEWSEVGDPVPYSTRTIGMHFDGLSRGMHLEIKYDDSTTELEVHYKGYLVYKEVKGELATYIPIDEWEGWIERLFKSAKEIQRRLREKEFEDQVQETEKRKAGWLVEMAKKWGFVP